MVNKWFEDEFVWKDLYHFLFSSERFKNAEEEIEKICSVINVHSGSVLDLCCGPGRNLPL